MMDLVSVVLQLVIGLGIIAVGLFIPTGVRRSRWLKRRISVPAADILQAFVIGYGVIFGMLLPLSSLLINRVSLLIDRTAGML